MDARCSWLRFGKQMLISRNAKCGWRRQWMTSDIGWIAYAHICIAYSLSYARPDLVSAFLGRGLWVLLVKKCHYRKLFINERAHQPLLCFRLLILHVVYVQVPVSYRLLLVACLGPLYHCTAIIFPAL